MKNFSRNLPYIIQDGKSIKDLVDAEKDRPAIVVGAGPSIYRNKHLDQLKNSNFKGVIIATDKMLEPLLKKDIIPNYCLSLDAHPTLVPAFYRHSLVKKNADKIKVITGTFVSPNLTKLLKKLKIDTYWFSASADRKLVLMTASERNPNALIGIRSCGNTGAASFTFSWAILKCNPTCIIGFDFGYPEGVNLEETPYYSGALVLADKTVSALTASPVYQTIYHPVWRTRAKIDPVFSTYRTQFLGALKNDLPPDIKLYNCTCGGTLFGEGMECISFKEFLEKVKRNQA